jgi:LysM repeat protein
MMKTRLVLVILLLLTGVVLLWSQIPAAASPVSQVAYPSPTPGPDGRIIYKVKAGETCTQISLLYGVSVEYIRTTNLLDENCTLREGQDIMIGVGGPSIISPTPNPAATVTPATPTATPEVGGTAQVCVLVYNDANGDGLRQDSEGAIPGAALSLTSADGSYSKTLTSVINPDATAYQGMCFADVPPGKYSVSAAAPEGYNATINLTSSVEIIPGDTAYVDFGAQARVVTDTSTTTPSKSPSPVLGLAGAALLLAGAGLGIYTWSVLRKK